MFFIGAPLGAIIRKGGLGLPIVFAILIFITFHFINTFGKRVAQENGMSAFLGCWLSTMVLLPLAIVLTKRATADKGITINFDWLVTLYNRFFPVNKEVSIIQTTPQNAAPETTTEVATHSQQIEVVTPIDGDLIRKQRKEYKKYSSLALISNLLLLLDLGMGLLKGAPFIGVTTLLALIFLLHYGNRKA